MADKKISELTALTGANVATDDQLVIVDTSAALTKSITIDEFKNALDTATGFVRITGDTMTGALDVQSTITADGLTVDADTATILDNRPSSIAAGDKGIIIGRNFDTPNRQVEFGGTFASFGQDPSFYVRTADKLRLKVFDQGDISFYEDTGTTAKFFWDASAESLGIGSVPVGYSSALSALQIGGNANIAAESATGASQFLHISQNANFDTDSSWEYISTDEATSYYQSSGTHVWRYAASGTAGNDISWSEAMRIDSSGHVLINNTAYSANGTLVVQQTADSKGIGIIDSAAANTFFLENDGTINKIRNNAAVPIAFETNDTERMRIDSSGNVGIGTSPQSFAKLQVKTDTNKQIAMFSNTDGATIGGITDIGGSTTLRLAGAPLIMTGGGGSGSEAMRIDSSGRLGIGTSSPSEKLEVAADVSSRIKNQEIGGNSSIWLQQAVSSYLIADSDWRFYTNNLERAVIDSSGNVGIGTDSPVNNSNRTTLGLQGVWGGQLDIMVGSTVHAQFGTDNFISGQSARIQSQDGIVFRTNGSSEAMRIDSSGNLLKNTASTISTGSNTDTGIQLSANNQAIFMASGGPSVLIARNGSVGEVVRFGNQGTGDVGSIDVTTTSTSYNTSSDYRLKENVVELTGATTRLKQLEPKRFNFIADADTTVDGFLAHEVQSIVPEAITGTHNEVDEDGNPVYQGIDQSKLVPLLVATIQELEARITALENA